MRAPDELLTRPVWWLVLRQGLPMAVGMACHALFNLIDLWMVGRFGAAAVAGVHVATSINFVAVIAGHAFSSATITLIAQAIGRGDRERAQRLSAWSHVVMLAGGSVVAVAGALLAGPSVALMGVGGEARTVGVAYLVTSNLALVTVYALMQCTAVMRARGEATMPFALLIGANLLNVALNWPFMYGIPWLGLDGFGAVGAAIASGVARLAAVAVGLVWIARPSYPLRLSWALRRAPGALAATFDLAGPQAVQMIARVAPLVLLTRLAGDIAGEPAIAALGVATRLDSMVLFASIGFASAATAVAGQNYGAGCARRVLGAGRHAGIQALTFGALVVTVLAVFARDLIGVFVATPGEDVLEAGTVYLQVATWSHPLAAFCIGVTGAVNGAGRTRPPMVLDVAAFGAVLLPVGLLLVRVRPETELVDLWALVIATQAVLLVAYVTYLEGRTWLQGVPATMAAQRSGSGGLLTD